MKKIILSICFLIISMSSFAQNRALLFEESFDNASVLPAGWIKMGIGLFNWSISETAQAGGEPNEVHLSWEPEFDGITRLVSPVIDLTNVSSIGIQFRHNLYFWDDHVTLGIATTSDNGATWHECWSIDYTAHSNATQISESIANEDVGSSNFRFCIFVDAKSFNFDDWWFDDFSVFSMVNFDAGLSKLTIDNQQVAGKQEVACSVENTGFDQINSVELNYQFDDGDIFTELFEVDLASFIDTTLTFQDQAVVYEGSHELKVWISKVNGLVDGSAINDTLTKMINVTLGNTERNPMLELFSASTCAPCVEVNQTILELLSQNPGRYTISKYQMNWPGSGDPYYNADGGVRRNYYGVSGVPTAFIDGEEFYPYTQEVFDNAANKKSFVDIKGTFNMEGNNIQVSVDVMSYGSLTDAILYVAVNEKTTTGNVGTNGETEFHHVMMKFLPNAQGTTLNLTAGNNQHFEFSADLSGTHIEGFEDLEVSAFIQDYSTKYVYNSRFLYEYSDVHPYPPSSMVLTDHHNKTMTATWTVPEGDQPTGYNLYINGALILDNTDVTTYNLTDADGFYVVEVSANYPEGKTSVRLAKSIVVSEHIAISEMDVPAVLVYPNPTKDVVNIQGTDVAKVFIYNGSGKLVASLNGKKTFNVSSYPSGIYYMMIESENGNRTVKKLVINR